MFVFALGVGSYLFINFLGLWASLAITVKRYHDRNKLGGWILIGIIPYVGWIWMIIELGFLKGTVGPNQFGTDPLESKLGSIEAEDIGIIT
jgi:uncharacterized membrane protein YhaH (DUF805 family)